MKQISSCEANASSYSEKIVGILWTQIFINVFRTSVIIPNFELDENIPRPFIIFLET